MYRIRKSIDLDFAHHVRGHEGACINIHGHTWKFEVELGATELDAQGFVVDFGELKREVLRPCHRLLDHALAVGETTFAEVEKDLAGIGSRLLATQATHKPGIDQDGDRLELAGARLAYPGGMKVAVFPFSPTSERLARWLHGLAVEKLENERVHVVLARVYETLHPVMAVAEYAR